MSKLEAIINQYKEALDRFREVLIEPKTDIVRDSAIQRFEFTLDLAWKTLKALLEDRKGIVCQSPKECFREAYRQGLIDYDQDWIKFVDLRNEAVHTYNKKLADQMYKQLPNTLNHFEKLFEIIKKELE